MTLHHFKYIILFTSPNHAAIVQDMAMHSRIDIHLNVLLIQVSILAGFKQLV